MSARLPLWYERGRGTQLPRITLEDDDGSEYEEPGLGIRLGRLLFGWITEEVGLVAAVVLPFIVLATATAASSQVAPLAAVFLGLAAVLWLLGTSWVCWLEDAQGDEAPRWAARAVRGLTDGGRATVAAIVIGTVLLVVLAFLAAVIASLSNRSR
jgi:hypothetical protein